MDIKASLGKLSVCSFILFAEYIQKFEFSIQKHHSTRTIFASSTCLGSDLDSNHPFPVLSFDADYDRG